MLEINVLKDFSSTPGGRHIKDGKYSGEEFYKKILEPYFKKALLMNMKIFIDLDGTYGYPSSFIDESFGQLSRNFGSKKVLDTFIMKSEDEIKLIDQIKDNIIHPEKYHENEI